MNKGWVYALYSENSPLIKIGMTATSPSQRIKEINLSGNYGLLGPWMQLDVRQVKDIRAIETALHRSCSSRLCKEANGTRELFHLTKEEARAALNAIPAADLNSSVPINRLNLSPDFTSFILALFRNSGLDNFRDLQESWTFSLFPKTNGGRYFTINIDRHEVAFSSPLEDDLVFHSIVVDQMALKDRQLKNWLNSFDYNISKAPYQSNWGNAVTVKFIATFDQSLGIFELTGFRRALIAYWYEALLRMQDRGTRSLFARFHNYNATSEIFRHLRESKKFRTVLSD